jgi:hypothetical protein
MPKKNPSLLGAFPPAGDERAAELEPAAVARGDFERQKRRNSNAGRLHIGGYFDPEDPIAREFRMIATAERRSQQDLLAAALTKFVEDYRALKQFGGKLELP